MVPCGIEVNDTMRDITHELQLATHKPLRNNEEGY